MTVGVCIRCSDGVVVACDSLTTFGRGVPIQKHGNKIHVLNHDQLENPVAIAAAGMTTYFDKFRDMALRISITQAYEELGRKLDIVDFCELVCEPGVLSMYKRYVLDRARFLESPPASENFSLFLIVAGATRDGELRAYFVWQDGITEQIDSHGTIGSGAAYAELFLRFLLRQNDVNTSQAADLAVYAIKGVELMDPNVGGPVNIEILKMDGEELNCTGSKAEVDAAAESVKQRVDQLLQEFGEHIGEVVREKGVVDISEGTKTEMPPVGRAVEEVRDAAP